MLGDVHKTIHGSRPKNGPCSACEVTRTLRQAGFTGAVFDAGGSSPTRSIRSF